MNIFDVILIGVALSIDACALTIANCTTYKDQLTPKKELAMPAFFALFQGVMPLIGYFIGFLFKDYLSSIMKFITAGIFLFLAVKIVIDILKENDCEKPDQTCKVKYFALSLVLIQAVATSIDALAVGVTLLNLNFSVFIAVAVIAGVTFVLVSLALFFGKTLGKLFGSYAEWVGVAILLILATKYLVEALL
ncbi:MAG: manganese efflux pump [Clostridia bacterium]|nr:manganese efflux pump [Clostridia bacterium]